jgi:hypothetical protein
MFHYGIIHTNIQNAPKSGAIKGRACTPGGPESRVCLLDSYKAPVKLIDICADGKKM